MNIANAVNREEEEEDFSEGEKRAECAIDERSRGTVGMKKNKYSQRYRRSNNIDKQDSSYRMWLSREMMSATAD